MYFSNSEFSFAVKITAKYIYSRYILRNGNIRETRVIKTPEMLQYINTKGVTLPCTKIEFLTLNSIL